MNLAPKTPTEDRLYEFDFTNELALGDDFITGFTLARLTGTVSISDQAWGAKIASAVIGGGANNETATFLATINTAGNQTIIRSLSLLVITAGQSPYSNSTKGYLVNTAYAEASLAGYNLDASAAEIQVALNRLDDLMDEWAASSKDLGYNQPATSGGSLAADPSGIPNWARKAVGVSLALALFPTLGKAMSAESRMALAQSMNVVRAKCTRLPDRRLPGGVPVGAGARPWNRLQPFTPNPTGYAEAAVFANADGGEDTANISDMAAIFEDHADGL